MSQHQFIRLEKECYVPSIKFFPRHSELNNHLRKKLITWLYDVGTYLKMQFESIHWGIYLLDIYLDLTIDIKKDDLQCVGATCLYIGSKLNDVDPITADEIIYLSNSGSDGKIFYSREQHILETFKYKLIVPIPYLIVHSYKKNNCDITPEMYHVIKYILSCETYCIDTKLYKPTLLAISAIYIAIVIIDKYLWDHTYIDFSTYTEEEIISCAHHMITSIQNLLKTTDISVTIQSDLINDITDINCLTDTLSRSHHSKHISNIEYVTSHSHSHSHFHQTTPPVHKDFNNLIDLYDYANKTILGTGQYGTVYKIKNKFTGTVVALKHQKFNQSFLREIAILTILDHPNIVKACDVFWGTATDVFFSMEIMETNLKSYLKPFKKLSAVPQFDFSPVCDNRDNRDNHDNPGLDIQTYRAISYQILAGIAYCHVRGIIHRDLKPSNILINSLTNEIKIADFGISRAFCNTAQEFTPDMCTLWYRPPELLLEMPIYDEKIDIWSIGCICMEMLEGKILFRGTSVLNQIKTVFTMMGCPSEEDWPGISKMEIIRAYKYTKIKPRAISKDKLLNKMLEMNPANRISSSKCLEYFPEYHALEHPKSKTKSNTDVLKL